MRLMQWIRPWQTAAHNRNLQTGGRQKPAFKTRTRLTMLILTLAGGLACATTGLWLWRESIGHQMIQASAEAGLRLEKINIRGNRNVTEDVLVKATGLSWHTPILAISLEEVHDRVIALGWVHKARVERRLPDTLVITLEERTAISLLQSDGQHFVISTEGDIIPEARPEDFRHLRVISGTNAAAGAAEILQSLETEPELFDEVWALIRQAGRRWDVILRNNIRIQLPESDPTNAWSRIQCVASYTSTKCTSRKINISLKALFEKYKLN